MEPNTYPIRDTDSEWKNPFLENGPPPPDYDLNRVFQWWWRPPPSPNAPAFLMSKSLDIDLTPLSISQESTISMLGRVVSSNFIEPDHEVQEDGGCNMDLDHPELTAPTVVPGRQAPQGQKNPDKLHDAYAALGAYTQVTGPSAQDNYLDHANRLAYPTLNFVKPNIPRDTRTELLRVWRARAGLKTVSVQSGIPNGPQLTVVVSRPTKYTGAHLSGKILDRIVRFMLADAPSNACPRTILKNFALASKLFRGVAAPYIYQHVRLLGNGDAGVYVRMDNAQYIKSITIQFDPGDPWSPYGTLTDEMLYPNNKDPGEYSKFGIQTLFPKCNQVSFVAKAMTVGPDSLEKTWALGLGYRLVQSGSPAQPKLHSTPDFLVWMLTRIIPNRVRHVALELDIAEAVSKFAVTLVARSGNPSHEIQLDLVSHSDRTTQIVEHAIRADISRLPGPIARTHIMIRGPTYGSRITWDVSVHESAPVMDVWRTHEGEKQGVMGPTFAGSGATGLSLPKACFFPAPEPYIPRRSTRPSTSPYKRPVPTHPPEQFTQLPPVPEEIEDPVAGSSSGESSRHQQPFDRFNLLPDQLEAWRAGELVAADPSIVNQVISQVIQSRLNPNGQDQDDAGQDDPYHEFWSFVDAVSSGQAETEMLDPAARAEMEAFVGGYREMELRANSETLTNDGRERAEAEKENGVIGDVEMSRRAPGPNEGERAKKRSRRR